MLQAAVLAEHSAATEVFAEGDDSRVGLHRLLQSQQRGLGVGQGAAHRQTPAPLFMTST